MLTRRVFLGLLSCSAFAAAARTPAPEVIVYKSPACGCCGQWLNHLRAHDFAVTAVDVGDINAYKRQHGVPLELGSCHTALVSGYVIEGHVPAEDIRRLLQEKSDIAGLAVPGMPASAPGMDVPGRRDPYDVRAFRRDGSSYVFSEHNRP